MTKIINLYHFEEEDGQEETQYDVLCDGAVEDKWDVGVIAGIIGHEVKLGRKPIVSVFLPKGDIEMTTRQVDPETGEIKDGQFVEIQPMPETALVPVDPVKDETIQDILKQVVDIERWANDVVVDSVDAEKKATNDLVIIGDLRKAIASRVSALVKPYQDRIDHIRGTVKTLVGSPLESADQTVRGKIKQYNTAKDNTVDAIDRQNVSLATQALNRARANNQPIDLPQLTQTGDRSLKTVRSDLGTRTLVPKRVWRWKSGISYADRMAALPSIYHQANDKLISDAVRKNPQLTDADFGSVIEIYNDSDLRITGKRGK